MALKTQCLGQVLPRQFNVRCQVPQGCQPDTHFRVQVPLELQTFRVAVPIGAEPGSKLECQVLQCPPVIDFVLPQGETLEAIDVAVPISTVGQDVLVPPHAAPGSLIQFQTLAPHKPEHVLLEHETKDFTRRQEAVKAARVKQAAEGGMTGAMHLHHEISGEFWGITMPGFENFMGKVHSMKADLKNESAYPYSQDLFDDDTIGPSMYQINDQVIKPLTRDGSLDFPGVSWALKCKPSGQLTTIFVTHAWIEGVWEFERNLREAWPVGKGPNGEEHAAYICFLSNPQNLDIGSLLEEVETSPFKLALSGMPSPGLFIVSANQACPLHERIWCVAEMFWASEQGRPIVLAGSRVHLASDKTKAELVKQDKDATIVRLSRTAVPRPVCLCASCCLPFVLAIALGLAVGVILISKHVLSDSFFLLKRSQELEDCCQRLVIVESLVGECVTTSRGFLRCPPAHCHSEVDTSFCESTPDCDSRDLHCGQPPICEHHVEKLNLSEDELNQKTICEQHLLGGVSWAASAVCIICFAVSLVLLVLRIRWRRKIANLRHSAKQGNFIDVREAKASSQKDADMIRALISGKEDYINAMLAELILGGIRGG